MNTFIGVCGVSPGCLPCNSCTLEGVRGRGGGAGRQMHAILLGLSRNVPILVLKDVSWEPAPSPAPPPRPRQTRMVGHLSCEYFYSP